MRSKPPAVAFNFMFLQFPSCHKYWQISTFLKIKIFSDLQRSRTLSTSFQFKSAFFYFPSRAILCFVSFAPHILYRTEKAVLRRRRCGLLSTVVSSQCAQVGLSWREKEQWLLPPKSEDASCTSHEEYDHISVLCCRKVLQCMYAAETVLIDTERMYRILTFISAVNHFKKNKSLRRRRLLNKVQTAFNAEIVFPFSPHSVHYSFLTTSQRSTKKDK